MEIWPLAEATGRESIRPGHSRPLGVAGPPIYGENLSLRSYLATGQGVPLSRMRLLRTALIVLALSAWAAGPLAGAAGARALAPTYQSSDPEDGAMLDHPPSEVTVTFSEPLDESSVMSVFDECGDEIDSGPATASLNELTVGIGETPGGTYKVVYTAVGVAGVTGQSNGSFDFMVHHGKSCKGEPGGHGNHDPGKGKGKGKGHDNGHDNGHGDDDDDDHDDHDSTSGSDHSGSSGSHDSGTHDSDNQMSGSDHSDGMNGGGHGKHDEHKDGPGKAPGGTGPGTQDGDTNRPVASGPGGAPVRADVQAMLIGLGLALAVGVLGGWLLRTTGGLFDPA